MTPIPLFDCSLSMRAISAIESPMLSGQLAAGPAVAELERSIEARFPERHAVAVSDMTHGLAIALTLANVCPGDEVLSLAFNCMSSNTAISRSGAHVKWVDVDPATASFDVEHARNCLTSRTKAVVVYHVSGYPADLIKIRQFCDYYGLALIEDANNAFGATIDEEKVGMVGDFAIFSFYANRQINAIDGGVILCREQNLADRARRLRRFGIDLTRFRDKDGEINQQTDIPEIGTSAALNNIHANLALISLDDVDERIARSRHNVSLLSNATDELALTPILPVNGGNPAYWTWLIMLANRDEVMRALKADGVMCTKLHCPNYHYSGFSSHLQKLPGTSMLEEKMLAIPCGWWIEEKAIFQITSSIAAALQTSS